MTDVIKESVAQTQVQTIQTDSGSSVQVIQGQVRVPVNKSWLSKQSLFLATPCYGGVCHGTYAKSIADLNKLTYSYGINMNIHMLFNESLITRARNYCVDEYMRSDFTHFLFVDSDVGFDPNSVIQLMALQTPESPYDVIGAAYPKKSYDGNTLIKTQNDGIKKVSWIVKNKYTGKVLSFNEERGFEWQPVINWFKSYNPYKKWVKLFYQGGSGSGKNLILTHDHDCMFIDDIINPVIKKEWAETGKNKWAVSNPENGIMPLYNKEQISFMIGTLLGDANISKKESRMSLGHGDNQKEYLELKQNIFGGKITGTYATEKNGAVWHLTIPVNAQTKYLRNIFYPNDKKSVKNVLQYIDEKALAFWIMDDGSLHNNNDKYSPYYRISTEGFLDEDQDILVEFFKNKWDIKASIVKNGNFKCLYINVEDSKKIFKLIAPYIPTCMEYKIPEEYRYIEKYIFNTKKLKYGASLVTEVQWLNDNKKRDQYDITVDINHNFVTKNITIFQCISWEKIVTAVNKGMADNNPEDLNKFVGDYVFNPKPGTTQIRLDKPCEVLEIGTGFMMIKRTAFEKFRDAHPEYLYKPDHVRTEHFDGHRQITQYFQAEIDGLDFRNFYEKKLKELVSSSNDPDKSNYIKEEINKILEEAEKINSTMSNRYLSEDYWFNQKLIALGLKIWLCPWQKLTHTGTAVYGGSLLDIAQLGASPTADVKILDKHKSRNKK